MWTSLEEMFCCLVCLFAGQVGDGASFSDEPCDSLVDYVPYAAQPHQNGLLLSRQQVVFILGPSGRCECPDDTADLAVAVTIFRLFFPGALLYQSINLLFW